MGTTSGSLDRARGTAKPNDVNRSHVDRSDADRSDADRSHADRSVRRLFAGLAGAAVMISVVTVFSRVLGFGRTMVFVYAVGPTSVGDAYSVANTLPNVLFEVAAGGALAGALIPVISGPLARGLRADVDRIASAVLGWVLLVLSVLAVAVVVLAAPIAGAFVTVAGSERDLVAALLVVFAPQIPLYGVAVVLSGVLQAQRRFFWPAFAPVLSSVVVICAYLVFRWEVGRAGLTVSGTAVGDLPPSALAWLAWGTTAGVAAMSLPLFIPTWRSGVRLRLTLRFPPGVARRVAGLAIAGVGVVLAQQVSTLVAARLAKSYGTDGTYATYLNVIQAVYLLPYAVLAVPLATSTFPRLAGRAAAGDRDGYARMAAVTTRAVLVAGGVGAAALIAAVPGVVDVFAAIAGGNRTLVASMGPALTWIAPGLLGLGLIFHVSRSLYALERGRAAVTAASLGWLTVVVASIVACWLLVPEGRDGPATLNALAIGTTIGMTVGGAALLVAVRRAGGPGVGAGLGRTLAVILLAGSVGSIAGRWTVDAVLAMVGRGALGAVGAAAGGACIAVAVVLGGIWWADRSTLTGLRSAGGWPVSDAPLTTIRNTDG
ncbi:MAG: murein biosynthesis integral membrane protein MurJ [Cellulomonas sp.]